MSKSGRDARDADLARLQARFDLEDRLRRSLDVVETETEALAVVEAALGARFGSVLSVLMPDATALRLGPARIAAGDDRLDEVTSCVAFRRGSTTIAPSSLQFDACDHLRSGDEPLSGVCVPIGAGGTTIGVLHWIGPHESTLDPIDVGALEAVGHLLASRILLLRDNTVEVPRIDPLTGLLNPHSTMLAILGLITELVPFSLAVCVLDDFDDYNAEHGHDTGDQALRLFSRSLTATVRPNDVVGRTDLDQFTVVFPATSALDAAQALERVRETLVLSLAENDIPNFSASFGVADSNQGNSIESIIDTASVAVTIANAGGQNRVVVAGEETMGSEPDDHD